MAGSLFGRGDESGQAAVELVIVLPVLLLVVLSAVQFVLLVNNRTIVQHAAMEGARAGAVGGLGAARRVARRHLSLIAGTRRGIAAPRVVSRTEGNDVVTEVRLPLSLLPFIRDADTMIGGDGIVWLRASGRAKIEPYLGEGIGAK